MNLFPSSPDFETLQLREEHLVFDYGGPIRKAKVLGPAYTQERLSLWNKHPQQDGIKAVATKTHTIPKARVRGLIYSVPTEQLVTLDIQRQNGVQFLRKKVPLFLPATKDDPECGIRFKSGKVVHAKKIVEVEAFMYRGIAQYWENIIDWSLTYYRHNDSPVLQLSDRRFNLEQDHPLQMDAFFEQHRLRPTRTPVPIMRGFEEQQHMIMAEAMEQDTAERAARLNPTIEQPRNWIYINDVPTVEVEKKENPNQA